jgi:hypothetical protein
MNIRMVTVIALLFGAVAVDFTSRLLSIGFDLFFVSLAVIVITPALKSGKKKE